MTPKGVINGPKRNVRRPSGASILAPGLGNPEAHGASSRGGISAQTTWHEGEARADGKAVATREAAIELRYDRRPLLRRLEDDADCRSCRHDIPYDPHEGRIGRIIAGGGQKVGMANIGDRRPVGQVAGRAHFEA